jgi:hypothetical protein
MNLIPEDLAEKAGGELKLSRFTNVSKSWILNQENQSEFFTFSFDRKVLITALGIGNSAKVGTFITLNSIKII